MKKVTTIDLCRMKVNGEKIVMVTAYDAATASIVDTAGVDAVLVGDSLGNVIQGRANTLGVTMDEMVYHTQIVSRGIKRAFLTADMPFMSYQGSIEDALRNAGRFLKESGAQAVKLEVNEQSLDTIYAIRKAGIPVMAHIGLCPQSIHAMGGYRVQGRMEGESARLLKLAKEIEERGAFSLVLESIPRKLAREITDSLRIPTIGIGAGTDCDGQVLVINDLLGISEEPLPKFVKKYAELRKTIHKAVSDYADEVKAGTFPAPDQSYD